MLAYDQGRLHITATEHGYTNDLADACSNCHEVYRDKGPADSPARCSVPAKK